MNMSKTNLFLSEIAERQPIPPNKLAYFQTRLRYSLYDYILAKFAEMEKKEGLTKADLARRIGCRPEIISRRLGAPGNWTLDTVSDLLIGIAGEELDPQSKSVLGRARRNYDGQNWREPQVVKSKALVDEKKKEHRSAAETMRPRDDGRQNHFLIRAVSDEAFRKRTATGPSLSLRDMLVNA